MDSLHDAYLQRAVRLARVADNEAAKVASGLKAIHTRIMKRIAIEYAGLSAAKIGTLNKVIEDLVVDYYRSNVDMSLQEMSSEVMQKEMAWSFNVMAQLTGAKLAKPILKDAVERANAKPYQGHTFAKWFKAAGVTNSARIVSQLSKSWLEGNSVSDTIRQVFSIAQRAEADVKTLTRSYFMHMSVEARERSNEAYTDYIGGYVWSAILDSRTTPHICGVRDQLQYDENHEPIGHDLPWREGPGRIHFNCRSQSIPFVKDERPKVMERAAVDAGENYERGDNTTATGKVRKPTKANREAGIFEINMVTTRTKYEGWLRKQPTAFVADVLGGVEKARAFKAGESLRAYLPDSGPGALGKIDNISISNL